MNCVEGKATDLSCLQVPRHTFTENRLQLDIEPNLGHPKHEVDIHSTTAFVMNIFFNGSTAPLGPRPPHFTTLHDHTLRHTTLGRTPLDEWSARRRNLYLTTHNTHKRQTSMPPAGFEPTILVSERPQTQALDRAATGIGYEYFSFVFKVVCPEFLCGWLQCSVPPICSRNASKCCPPPPFPVYSSHHIKCNFKLRFYEPINMQCV